MRTFFRGAFAALSLSLLLPFFGLSAQDQTDALSPPLPLEEYGKLPEVERSAISPSGKRIALLATMQGPRLILAVEDQTKVLTSIGVGDMKIRSIRWIGEDRILVISSQTEDLGPNFTTDKAEFYVGRIIPLSAEAEGGIIFANERKLVDVIVGNYGIREVDGRYYGYFGAIELGRAKSGSRLGRTFRHGRPYLYKVDLEDYSATKIANAADEGSGKDWVIDQKGQIAATRTINYTTGAWDVRNAGGAVIAKGTNPSGRVSLIGLGYDGSAVIMREFSQGRSRWTEVPLSGGDAKPFLDDTDFDRLFFDNSGLLMGYVQGLDEENETPIFADPTLSAKAKKVQKAFAAYESRMMDWTDDLGQVIVRTSGNKDSGSIYAVDLSTLRANALAYERTAITPDKVGATSVFEYTASDGLEMDGILTLPPGREAKNLPVIVFPHGGPHAHDTVAFDWWAQAFASRGYAVFQPNFRGSTNRDGDFRRAGYGQWGRKMQTDKSDGLAALAEAGIVDANRACIVGASYGGYAALAGVTLQQGLYRCAVAVAPVADIRDMYLQDYRATGRDRTTKVALLEQLGDRSSWDEVSPVRAAARADAPIMLIHGKDDIVVPYSHSAKMADKLKDADKPYELVTLEGEDHWLSLSETRQLMLRSAVRFVEEHNPAD